MSFPAKIAAAYAARAIAAPRSRRGFALLVVIWVLALLTLLAMDVAGTTRTAALLARNQFETARARALAEAGLTQGIMGLLAPYDGSPWHVDGRVRLLEYAGGQIAVSLRDEGGKIDVNAAPIEVIGGLMTELGVEPGQVAAITDEIAARRRARALRDNTTIPSLRGSALADGRIYRAPFSNVESLRLMPSMTRDVYERLRPFTTVFSGSDRVNPMTAAREVLLAIPGIRADEVEALLEARAAPEQEGIIKQFPPLTDVARYVGPVNAQVATITARGMTERGASFIREAVVALGGEPQQPFRILAWRQLVVTDDAAATAAR